MTKYFKYFSLLYHLISFGNIFKLLDGNLIQRNYFNIEKS